MTTHINRWQIPGSNHQPIYGNTHLPSQAPIGVLVICHGYKGYKDYGFFPALADTAAKAGFIAHRFNFSHSGMTHEYETFANAEAFEHDTWHKQIQDVLTVLKAAPDQLNSNSSQTNQRLPVVLFGHSRGGLTSILTAAQLSKHKPKQKAAQHIQYQATHDQPNPLAPPQSPEQHSIQLSGLITAAAVADPIRLTSEEQQALLSQGRLPITSARTGQTLYIGSQWLKEVQQDPQAYNPVDAIKHITCPICIIHGEQDPTVDIQDAHELHQAQPESKLITIPKANHVFNAPNPWPVLKSGSPSGATSDSTPASYELQDHPIAKQMIDTVIGFAQDCCKTN